MSLLKLGSFLKREGVEVKLIDVVRLGYHARLKRKRVDFVEVDDISAPKWRYGLPQEQFTRRVEALRDEGWLPEEVVVDCLITIWWEGAREATDVVRSIFPEAKVTIIGTYPHLARKHAQAYSGADALLPHLTGEVTSGACDFSLYEGNTPQFGYVAPNLEHSSPERIVAELEHLLKAGISRVALAQHGIIKSHPDLFRSVLNLSIARGLKPHLYALGSINPVDFVEHPDLPNLMRQAGYKQISFADDRYSDEPVSQLIADYADASRLCFEAGFQERTEALNAGISIGKPGEDLEERARLASHFAHHAGSVIFWPYQPTPDEGLDLPLELQNGKLFPYRAKNGYSYRDYLNVLGIGTVFNARYRSKSFDFLGGGLMSRLWKESVSRRGWDPDPAVKGSAQLPARRP